MKFKTVRVILFTGYVIALVLCVLGLISHSYVLAIPTIALFIVVGIFDMILNRCPYCGQKIHGVILANEFCPHCGKNMIKKDEEKK